MNVAVTDNVRKILLADPSRMDATEAAIRILSERSKCERDVAQLRLTQVKQTEEAARLFERVMPAEYKQTLARSGGSRFDAAHGFVLQLGFPLYDFWDRLNDDALREIPIEPMGFHICDDCYDFRDFKLEYQLGILMMPNLYEDEVFFYDEEEEAFFEDRQENQSINWAYFARTHGLDNKLKPEGNVPLDDLYLAFSKSRTPLRFFTELWSFIRHSTGSTFLDFDGNDYSPEIPWSRQAVIDLRREYALAQKILAHLEKLHKWLAEDRVPRINQALRLYAKTRKPVDEKPKRRRRKGAALIRIL